MYNNASNAYALYQQNDVYTSSQGKLLLMLYDGAIKFMRISKFSIAQGDYPAANKNLIKAQNIITELMCTLNMEYDISKNLYGLYDYMKRRLIEANIRKDTEIIDEILDLVVGLRDTWQKAIASL